MASLDWIDDTLLLLSNDFSGVSVNDCDNDEEEEEEDEDNLVSIFSKSIILAFCISIIFDSGESLLI